MFLLRECFDALEPKKHKEKANAEDGKMLKEEAAEPTYRDAIPNEPHAQCLVQKAKQDARAIPDYGQRLNR